MTNGQKFAKAMVLLGDIIEGASFYNSGETANFSLFRGLTKEEADFLNDLKLGYNCEEGYKSFSVFNF